MGNVGGGSNCGCAGGGEEQCSFSPPFLNGEPESLNGMELDRTLFEGVELALLRGLVLLRVVRPVLEAGEVEPKCSRRVCHLYSSTKGAGRSGVVGLLMVDDDESCS